jgi:hypothetical protein
VVERAAFNRVVVGSIPTVGVFQMQLNPTVDRTWRLPNPPWRSRQRVRLLTYRSLVRIQQEEFFFVQQQQQQQQQQKQETKKK